MRDTELLVNVLRTGIEDSNGTIQTWRVVNAGDHADGEHWNEILTELKLATWIRPHRDGVRVSVRGADLVAAVDCGFGGRFARLVAHGAPLSKAIDQILRDACDAALAAGQTRDTG